MTAERKNKICINAKFVDGPFGGGIKFANDLKAFLQEKGFTVINTLDHPDIDVIKLFCRKKVSP